MDKYNPSDTTPISNCLSKIDEWLDKNYFKGKRNGVFFEAGANDGIRDSISFYFEKYFSWRGILAEPILPLFQACRKNRAADNYFFHGCIGECYKDVELTVPVDNLDNSSLCMTEEHKANLRSFGQGKQYIQYPSMMVPCPRLIWSSGFNHIDLFILDVEGYENKILYSMMMEKVFPEIMVVEFDWSSRQELLNILRPSYDLIAQGQHDFILKRKS